ncbi:hypothetical protein [Bradyrhizobium hereditatis]|uniref:hypothetical protein n=1 Tax=Bradyrhizobium hereditatis TaxID=2821405 RepID=UPI001CE33803|nr:hypothetical protein [Bradyrhizobium hereditatis]
MAFFVRGTASPGLTDEGAAMRIAGWSFGKPEARLALLPAIAIVGCTTWLMLPQASDAESRSTVTPPEVAHLSQDASRADDTAATQATLSKPAPSAAPTDANPATIAVAPPDVAPPETTAPPRSPLDGLKIVSQSWRRGGLGSKALVTFTLRNTNDYAVKDIEIACTFTRRDGSRLTDRRRVIPDTVNMKSRKRYAGVLVGFVNVNANKAKCSLVTASRI